MSMPETSFFHRRSNLVRRTFPTRQPARGPCASLPDQPRKKPQAATAASSPRRPGYTVSPLKRAEKPEIRLHLEIGAARPLAVVHRLRRDLADPAQHPRRQRQLGRRETVRRARRLAGLRILTRRRFGISSRYPHALWAVEPPFTRQHASSYGASPNTRHWAGKATRDAIRTARGRPSLGSAPCRKLGPSTRFAH